MGGASLLNPSVDTLMIATINTDGFNGPLSECLSCSAVLNNNFFVPQKQHGQKAHFPILCAPAARAVLKIFFIGPQNERSENQGGPWARFTSSGCRRDFRMHLESTRKPTANSHNLDKFDLESKQGISSLEDMKGLNKWTIFGKR